MSTTVEAPRVSRSTRRGRWIDEWDPENERFWETTGRRIARRNLAFSIFAENLGFSIWVLWTIVVINLANIGIEMSLSELFWLTAVPNLIGATLRIPYTFAVPRFGGRAWTTFSASLLLIPALALAIVVPSGWLADQGHATQFWVLLACAAWLCRRHWHCWCWWVLLCAFGISTLIRVLVRTRTSAARPVFTRRQLGCPPLSMNCWTPRKAHSIRCGIGRAKAGAASPMGISLSIWVWRWGRSCIGWPPLRRAWVSLSKQPS